MTSRDFAFWIQGFFEISDAKTLTEAQVEMIKKHLHLVFKHEIEPSMGDKLVDLKKIHDWADPFKAPDSAGTPMQPYKTEIYC